MRIKNLLIVVLIIHSFLAFANTKDSLIALVNSNSINDTNQLKTIKKLAYYYLLQENNYEKALSLTLKGIKIAKAIKSDFWSGKYNAIAGYIKQSYTTDYAGSIQFNFLALKYYDKANATKEKFAVYLNLGNLYYTYKQYADAEIFFKNAEEIALKFNMEDDLALTHINIGALYNLTNRQDLSTTFYLKARKYYTKIESELDIAKVDYNIINITLQNLPNNNQVEVRLKSIKEFKKLIEVFEKYEDKDSYLSLITSLGIQQTETNQLNEGEKYLLEAENLASPSSNYSLLLQIYSMLAQNYHKRNDFKNESICLWKLANTNTALFSQNKTNAIAEVQIKYQTEKIEAENKILHNETRIKDLEISKKDIELFHSKTIRYSLISGLSLIIVFTLFLYNRFKVIHKQKKTIEFQKKIVDEKQDAIIDSINYAKRIQQALMPSDKYILKSMKRLNKPKN